MGQTGLPSGDLGGAEAVRMRGVRCAVRHGARVECDEDRALMQTLESTSGRTARETLRLRGDLY